MENSTICTVILRTIRSVYLILSNISIVIDMVSLKKKTMMEKEIPYNNSLHIGTYLWV